MCNKILPKKRIEWIDTAKGFLLLCVIAGHSVSKIQKIVYAFHIPLFILLSGYTHKSSENFQQCFLSLQKAFKKIYIPMLITLIIQAFIVSLKSHNFSFLLFLKSILYCKGVIWFFCTIFWAKFFYNILSIKKLSSPSFICIIFIIGFLVIKKLQSINYIIQIQNMDMVPIFICLLYIGKNFHLWTQQLTESNKTILCFTSFIIWTFNYYKFHLDFGLKIFNGGIYCFIIPACAIYFIINFCIELDKISFARKTLSFLGKNTVLILCIHHIDKFFITKNENTLPIVFLLFRMTFIFVIFAIIYLCLQKLSSRKT